MNVRERVRVIMRRTPERWVVEKIDVKDTWMRPFSAEELKAIEMGMFNG